jgi:excisionase family DNA binding protein
MARVSKNTIAVEPRLLNIKAAAHYLSTTVWLMRTLIWKRAIPFLKLGNAYIFDKQDLDAFITASKTGVR